jgi:methionyl aminopeptidase
MIYLKSPAEINCMREAGRIIAGAFECIAAKIEIGISTEEIDRLLDEFIVGKGGMPSFKGYRGYKFASCISINEEVVHGLPSTRKLKNGDLVGIDIGVEIKGFNADAAKTFAVGDISQEALKLIEVTEKALVCGIAQAKIGNKVGAISAAIQKYVESCGFNVVRDLFGHGVGRSLHEEPIVPNFGELRDGCELQNGLTLAIEPMVNLGTYKIKTLSDGWTIVTEDKSLSAHFEHTIVVNNDLPEILTQG